MQPSLQQPTGESFCRRPPRNSLSRLLWRCPHSHEWLASLNSVNNSGSWGPSFAHRERRLQLTLAQQFAAAQSGVCLSDSYTNNFTCLDWQGRHGHKWGAWWKNSGRWCQFLCSWQTQARSQSYAWPSTQEVSYHTPSSSTQVSRHVTRSCPTSRLHGSRPRSQGTAFHVAARSS